MCIRDRRGSKLKVAEISYGNLVAIVTDPVFEPVSYTHLRAHETPEHLVCRLLLEKKNKPLARPARRQGGARGTPAQGRRVLRRGHLPGRRLPGDPGRPAQPLRRHRHGARRPVRGRWLLPVSYTHLTLPTSDLV